MCGAVLIREFAAVAHQKGNYVKATCCLDTLRTTAQLIYSCWDKLGAVAAVLSLLQDVVSINLASETTDKR